VSHKLSSRGKYVSVKIGPIRVVSSEQVPNVPLMIKYKFIRKSQSLFTVFISPSYSFHSASNLTY
jgi:putative lipoic acid-binding regulatory protein